MVCGEENQVQRYHDGELTPAERDALEAHLGGCAECRRLLADLRRLSSLISEAVPADMPTRVVERAQDRWSAAQDRGVLRVAGWMTAAAAAVLLGVLLVRHTGRTEVAARPAIWETVAVMPAMEVQEDANRDLIVMAQWMADDLSSGEQW